MVYEDDWVPPQEGEEYGCFRCGTIEGDYHHDIEGWTVCDNCGEKGTIFTLINAFDTLNECVRMGVLSYGPSIWNEGDIDG